jgi:hypothetical protein
MKRITGNLIESNLITYFNFNNIKSPYHNTVIAMNIFQWHRSLIVDH